ncbi:MAG: IS630 family transposase [Nocardioidaceae bacterium]
MSLKKNRRIPKSRLAEYRERALAMYAEQVSPRQIAKVLGCGRATVFGWLKAAAEGGLELEPSKPTGRPPKLSDSQVARLYAMLFTDPRQLEFEFGLWTRTMVAELIARKFGVVLSVSAVGRMLRHRLGMSPQRPTYRATQQDPDAIEAWKNERFPAIAARARREHAQIWFQDESGVRSDYHSGTTWAPAGRTPVVAATGARTSVNMISSVNAKGGMHFRLAEGRLTAEAFIDYLQALLADIPGKIFLIVDGHPAHKAKKVTRYVESTHGRLTLFFLPGYAPDLNPDEWVWKNIKHDHVGKAALLDEHQLRTLVHHALTHLQEIPATVRGFFNDPKLAYITAAT